MPGGNSDCLRRSSFNTGFYLTLKRLCFCLYSPVIYIVIFILQHDESNDGCDFRKTISRKKL